MEKEENYYERVSSLEWEKAYTYEEFIELIKTEFEGDPIFLNEARTLTTKIMDGDYTLLEGVDYSTLYYRGHGEADAAWFAVVFGKGKYEKLFFCAGEHRLPSYEREMQPGYKEMMKLFYPDEETTSE